MKKDLIYTFYKDEDIRGQLESELNIDGGAKRWVAFDEQFNKKGHDIKTGELKILDFIEHTFAEDCTTIEVKPVYVIERRKDREVPDLVQLISSLV